MLKAAKAAEQKQPLPTKLTPFTSKQQLLEEQRSRHTSETSQC